MKNSIALLLLMVLASSCTAQKPEQVKKPKAVAVAFYNVENLFDTKDDPVKHDDEFTPYGAYRYSEKVYRAKLRNIARVIESMKSSKYPDGPAIIGLAEVENKAVLKDLIRQAAIKDRGYKYLWYDSPDPRGIDVAMLYNPQQFKLLKATPVPITYMDNDRKESGRDMLFVRGILAGDTVFVMVNHWPSRREGQEKSEPKRVAAASINKEKVKQLWSKNIHANIIIMGDMNDNPNNKSIENTLGAFSNRYIKRLGFLYNPWAEQHKSGKGTSVYMRQWDLFDQIIVSNGLLDNNGWKFKKAIIHDEEFLKDTYKNAKGYPYRSFKGTHWIKGYSDHFPVLIELELAK